MKSLHRIAKRIEGTSYNQYLLFAIPLGTISTVSYLLFPIMSFSFAVYTAAFFEMIKFFLYGFLAVMLVKVYRKTKLNAYLMFTIGVIIWVPGQIIQTVTPITEHTPYLYSNTADLVMFCAIFFAIIGILLLGFHRLQRRERIQLIVHAVTLGSCAAFVATYFITIVFFQREVSRIQEHYFDLVSMSIDIILVAVCISIAAYRFRDRIVLAFVFGFLFQVITDILFLASNFLGETGTRPYQRMVSMFAALCWVSVVFVKDAVPRYAGNIRSEVLLAVTSYVSVGGLIVYTGINGNNLGNTPVVVINSFLLTFVAIFVAQIIGFFDNKRLVAAQQISIAEISESEERYQVMATHDTLTHLVNRVYFIDELSRLLAGLNVQDSPLAVMFIDLDRFKEINDTYGHDQGDKVITIVAHRIEGVLPDSSLLCRLGGDEFAVLVPSPTTIEQLRSIATDILGSVVVPIDLLGNEVYLTCSIGIALSSDSKRDSQELLKSADTAMYRAKELGRNRIEFADSRMKSVPQLQGWSLSELRRALVQEQISVHYQPIVNLVEKNVIAYEALARWNHPGIGFVNPKDFIALAEDNGLIVELGDSILRQAIRQLEQWDRDSPDNMLCLNLNLSSRQLRDENFITNLVSYCEQSSIVPDRVCFEMTESSLLGDVREVISALNELVNKGFHLYIDDFGTGYSSLSYLKKFPIAGFKIDRSFIRGIGVHEDDTAIVMALISLSKTLKLKVIAEGVQAIDVRDFLMEQGCDLAQGYLFAEPQPAENITITQQTPNNIHPIRTAYNS